VDGLRQLFRKLHAAFPDLEITPEQLLSEGDRVAVRLTLRGTHRGEFMGIPATSI
jgi:predicted ester cyclase